MSNSKEHKFTVGDVVKLINTISLYSSSNIEGEVRLESNKDYPVVTVDELNNFVEVMKENGEIEGCYGWRFTHVETIATAESLRNSILSLQQERVSMQEKIEQNIAQEKSLTGQLKELGFLLVESKEQPTNVVDEKKVVLYAEDIEEDMTDSRNWKVGDIIVATSHGYNNRLGVEYRLTKVGETIHYECLDSRFIKNEYVDDSEHEWLSSNYKFHSRPVVN